MSTLRAEACLPEPCLAFWRLVGSEGVDGWIGRLAAAVEVVTSEGGEGGAGRCGMGAESIGEGGRCGWVVCAVCGGVFWIR